MTKLLTCFATTSLVCAFTCFAPIILHKGGASAAATAPGLDPDLGRLAAPVDNFAPVPAGDLLRRVASDFDPEPNPQTKSKYYNPSNGIAQVPYTVPYTDVEGKVYTDVNGIAGAAELRFHCGTARFSRLCYKGRALSVRALKFHFSGIQWCPNDGGTPVYSDRLPKTDNSHLDELPFKGLPRHMLLVTYGGYVWCDGKNEQEGVGSDVTDVLVGPNDERLIDNHGGFDFIITGLSQ